MLCLYVLHKQQFLRLNNSLVSAQISDFLRLKNYPKLRILMMQTKLRIADPREIKEDVRLSKLYIAQWWLFCKNSLKYNKVYVLVTTYTKVQVAKIFLVLLVKQIVFENYYFTFYILLFILEAKIYLIMDPA